MNNRIKILLTFVLLLGLTSITHAEYPESSLLIIYDDASQEATFESPEVQGFQLQAASDDSKTRGGAREQVYTAIKQAFLRDRQAAGEAVKAALQSAGNAADHVDIPWFGGEIVQASAKDIDRCEIALNQTDAVKNGTVRHIRFELEQFLQPLQPLTVKPAPTAAGASDVQWGVAKIRAHNVWPKSTGKGIKVAVIDSGIDHRHPMFKPGQVIMLPQNNLIPNGGTPTDDRVIAGVGGGHGSHVAAIIAGQDGYGVAPDATLIAIKVFDRQGRTLAPNFLLSVNRAIEAKADVINMSFAAPFSGGNVHLKERWESRIQKAIDENIVVVAASGNVPSPNLHDIGLPGGIESVITVAATNSQDILSNGSIPLSRSRSFPNKPDVAAPGGNWNGGTIEGVPSAKAHTQEEIAMPGTSMAAPHVAGICALIKEDKPDLSPSQIKGILKSTAVDLKNTARAGAGRVDALAAYNCAIDPTTCGGSGGGNNGNNGNTGNNTARREAHAKHMTQLREIRDFWRKRNGRPVASDPKENPGDGDDPPNKTISTLKMILIEQRLFNAEDALFKILKEWRELSKVVRESEANLAKISERRDEITEKITDLGGKIETAGEDLVKEARKEMPDAAKMKKLADDIHAWKGELDIRSAEGEGADKDYDEIKETLEELKGELEVLEERKKQLEKRIDDATKAGAN